MDARVLLLPGWHNSDALHWQSRWQQEHRYSFVDQHDWDFPLRGDWITRLEDEVSKQEKVILVAHGLGCILVTAWARFTGYADRVAGALLVAPTDVERESLQQVLRSWSPIMRQELPFDATVVVSRNDPYCSFMRACSLAGAWGAQVVDIGHRGHVNDPSLGEWSQGHDLLSKFLMMVD
jgi:uncharacterized protein